MTAIAGAAAARKLLSHPNPPTAIVYAVDAAALGAWDVAHDKGLKIGHDLSIVAYDGSLEGATPHLPSPLLQSIFTKLENGLHIF